MNDYFVRVYPPELPSENTPLIDDAYVPPESEPEDAPESEPPRLHICRVLLVLWCIAFAAILGASYIYVIMYPLPAERSWQAIPLGVLEALLLWGVTLALYKCARRHR